MWFTKEEAKWVFWKLSLDNKLGLDGFSMFFLHPFWIEMKQNILNMIQEFESVMHLDRINYSQVALIPKNAIITFVRELQVDCVA